MDEIKGLSLTQPYATAIALGHKRYETRSWRTHYRGLVAIHAAKGFPRAARDFTATERAIGRIPARIPLGAIIAVARIAAVEEAEDAALKVSALERLYGDYSIGRWAWQLADVVALPEPIPYKGSLSLWWIDLLTADRLLGEYSAARGQEGPRG